MLHHLTNAMGASSLRSLSRKSLPFLLVGTMAGAMIGGAAAQQTSPFSDEQKNAIRALVKETLVQNPELIQEAMNELERRQNEAETTARTKAITGLSDALMNSSRATVLGNPQGDVTLVEFFDYNCGYCKKSLQDLKVLMQSDPKLRVVLRDFPVLGPDSVEAAMVAVATKPFLKGEKYWEFHVKLLESKGRVGKDRALAVAKELGVDMAKLQKEIESPETRATVEETMKFGDALRLQGTPAYVIGQDVVFGAVGTEPLRVAIESTRKCGKAAC